MMLNKRIVYIDKMDYKDDLLVYGKIYNFIRIHEFLSDHYENKLILVKNKDGSGIWSSPLDFINLSDFREQKIKRIIEE